SVSDIGCLTVRSPLRSPRCEGRGHRREPHRGTRRARCGARTTTSSGAGGNQRASSLLSGPPPVIQDAAYPGLTEPAIPPGLPRKWTVLAVLLAAPFLAVLDGFVVLVAVPSIQDQLHASDAGVQMIVAGYGVAYAAFLIAGGRLGDIHGRRKLLVVGLGLFAATSVLGAAAPNEGGLVLARGLQGGSAALVYP